MVITLDRVAAAVLAVMAVLLLWTMLKDARTVWGLHRARVMRREEWPWWLGAQLLGCALLFAAWRAIAALWGAL